MIRILGMTVAIFCTASVLTAAVLASYHWMQGTLDKETIDHIRLVMEGERISRETDVVVEESFPDTNKEIVQKRLTAILSLSARERELKTLKETIDEQSKKIVEERKQLETLQASFKKNLENEREKITTESAEQARSILLGMKPDSAVMKLMAVETEEAITLLKGMKEKDAAKILEKFSTVKQADVQKANDIFQAIMRGRGEVDLIKQANNELGQTAATTDTK